MLQNTLKFGLAGLILLYLSACTQVIDVDINSSDPQTVIEANLNTTGEPATVKLTQSINFDESNFFPAVSNALVVISDDLGQRDTLLESSAGLYTSSQIQAQSGRTYTLEVLAAGKTYLSSITIPALISFDSLVATKMDGGGFGPGGGGEGDQYEVLVGYQDPAESGNYYRFVEYVNGVPSGDNFVYDDRLNNGLAIQTRLMKPGRRLRSGDVLTIEMQCIAPSVYDYFDSFGNLFGGPQASSTPANPYTNIEGATLGYFNACTVERKTFVVP